MLIYFGGYSDSWVPDAVATARNRDIVALNLMDVMGDRVKADTLVTGMQHGHDEDHDSHEPEHEPEDEHIWLSLRAAKVLTQAIADTLSRLDNGNAAAYQDNAADYHAALAALDQEYAQLSPTHPAKRCCLAIAFPSAIFWMITAYPTSRPFQGALQKVKPALKQWPFCPAKWTNWTSRT